MNALWGEVISIEKITFKATQHTAWFMECTIDVHRINKKQQYVVYVFFNKSSYRITKLQTRRGCQSSNPTSPVRVALISWANNLITVAFAFLLGQGTVIGFQEAAELSKVVQGRLHGRSQQWSWILKDGIESECLQKCLSIGTERTKRKDRAIAENHAYE